MESEKVKEIKECLQSCNDDKMACYDCKYYEKCEKILTKNNLLTLINELESENELLCNAKVVYETVDYCYEDLDKAEKRFENNMKSVLEFEKKQAVKEVTEKVKMAFYYEFDEIIPSIMSDKIDELLKEYER